MRVTLIGSMTLVILFSGCATRPPVQIQTKFDYDIHKQYIQRGSNTIKGQAFLRQQGGGVVTCAGNPVYLLPATAFFREVMSAVKAGKNPQFNGNGQKGNEAYKSILKQSQCDAQGNFSFTDLPDGRWFVMAEVKWTIGGQQQGGSLLGETSAGNGETQILLTNENIVAR